MQSLARMPRRRRRRRETLPSFAAQMRVGLREAHTAIDDVLCDWLGDDDLADPIRTAVIDLYREVRMAIAIVDEDEPPPAAAIRARTTAIDAALRVNAALASAYQERLAPPRGILAACHAVARLIQRLHVAVEEQAILRWN
jgi:hypothetical protein